MYAEEARKVSKNSQKKSRSKETEMARHIFLFSSSVGSLSFFLIGGCSASGLEGGETDSVLFSTLVSSLSMAFRFISLFILNFVSVVLRIFFFLFLLNILYRALQQAGGSLVEW